MVTITRKSPFSGKVNEMTLPLDAEEFNERFEAWERGVLIQDAFPTLTADEREFIKTGITPQEWADTFGSEED